MATPDQKLFVLFGPLVKRITSIENYDNSLIPDLQGKAFKELDEVEVYKIPPADTIPFVHNLIDRIYDLTSNFVKLEEKIYQSMSTSLKTSEGKTGNNTSLIANNASDERLLQNTHSIMYCLQIELRNYFDDLLQLLDGLEKYQALTEPLPNVDIASDIPDRLRFNLPMDELVGLITVLMECDIIPKTKPALIKPIVMKHFASTKGEEMGERSIGKHLYPTGITLLKLNDIFVTLQKKCISLKKEKAKKNQ